MGSPLEHTISGALHRYWGKADPGLGAAAWHPLVLHSLDVAAVAHEYLKARPRLLARMAGWLGLDEDQALALICTLVSLHDIGKFGENFQSKRQDLFAVAFADRISCPQTKAGIRHDQVGALFVDDALSRRLGDQWPIGESFRILLTACCGHHGTPVTGHGLADDAMSDQAQTDAALWCRAVFALFDIDAETLRELANTAALPVRIATWWLAGLTVLADWVGSNIEWFRYATEEERTWPLQDYWDNVALIRAKRALGAANLLPQPLSAWRDFATLFPALAKALPTPAQQLCTTLPLGDRAQLLLLEDATGAGKTEAALVLAQRLMNRGLGDGLYFGLPTQATSDQMYERMDDVGPRLYADEATPAILLAHGQRNQNPLFCARHGRLAARESGDGPDTASQQVQQWLTQGSKRTLLGHVGVGTIDQMQMAGLRVKHQPLRLIGLFDKILVVDEVHAYDRYMQAVLCNVLRAHAAAGGSAILLSATLPLADRQQLFAAFADGHALADPPHAAGGLSRFRRSTATSSALTPPTSLEYPLLTHYQSGNTRCAELRIDKSPRSLRRVRIDYHDRCDDIDALLLEAHRAGRAACWIRNSVAEAIETYVRLSTLLPSDSLALFHSRFALADRLRIQQQVLQYFDRNSNAALRAGRIVIATQVVEQSLDVDFDVMVSDLAPIDVLLQRQGRLLRHLRDGQGNHISSGMDGRGEPVLVVYGPDRRAQPDAKWVSRHSRASGLIYTAHGMLWLTAQVIGDELILPHDFRSKVDAVYGEDAESPPDCFDDAQGKASGQGIGEQQLAIQNGTDWRSGYWAQASLDWQNDEHIGTRLGGSVDAVLLELRDGALQPWAPSSLDTPDEYDRLARSVIRLPEHWGIRHDALPADNVASQLVRTWRARLPGMKYRLPIVLVEGGAEVCNHDGRTISLRYDSITGLRRAG